MTLDAVRTAALHGPSLFRCGPAIPADIVLGLGGVRPRHAPDL